MKKDNTLETTKRTLGRKLAREIPMKELEKVVAGAATLSLADGHPSD
ncbi:MAG: hypothetical protein GY719_36580 [bacterium]|nr:hypothetical protein [bacterium]